MGTAKIHLTQNWITSKLHHAEMYLIGI